MKYVDFKVSVFALICLKYVADGQNGTITNGRVYFNSKSPVVDLRLNFTSNSMSAANKTNLNCISTLRTLNKSSYEMNVLCDECTKPCLPLSNTDPILWPAWSAWSDCSVTCGNGTKTRVKIYTGTNCTDNVQFNMTKCNATLECQDPMLWSAWSVWSNCSVTCGNGTKTRVKICTGTNCTDNVQFNITKCNATLECQDPILWSAWSAWSDCSVTCGNGTKTRVKICTGTNCTDNVQFNMTKCNATLECQDPMLWSAWSVWSNCSVTCGNGTKTRVKICTGTNCTDNVQFNITKCNATLECQDPILWSAWSAWSDCSVTCGNGTKTRVKICTGTNCTDNVQFNMTKCNATLECQDPILWSAWSAWSDCSVTCGNGTKTRVKIYTGTNCTDNVQFNMTKCNATLECQDPMLWSAWSVWSNCSVTCGNGTKTRVKICTGTNCTDNVQFNITKCNATLECQDPILWSAWSAWSDCSVTCGNGTKTRVKICTGNNCNDNVQFNMTICNATLECQEKSTETNRQEDVTDDAQNITSAHIAIVAIACFLFGILVAALVSIFYMKRKQQGCFIHNNKSVEVGSRMQSGSDLQSLTTRAIANEYESTDNKNENKTVETSYQSLDLDQISKDQQTYDHLEPEPPFEHRDNKPPSGHQKLTLRNGNSANITPSKIENVYEYEHDIQDNENVSRQCKPNSPKQQETQTVVEYMVREVRGENGNTDHVYSVLEPADNTRKMLGRQSDADHNYFVLETVDKVAEVGSG